MFKIAIILIVFLIPVAAEENAALQENIQTLVTKLQVLIQQQQQQIENLYTSLEKTENINEYNELLLLIQEEEKILQLLTSEYQRSIDLINQLQTLEQNP